MTYTLAMLNVEDIVMMFIVAFVAAAVSHYIDQAHGE